MNPMKKNKIQFSDCSSNLVLLRAGWSWGLWVTHLAYCEEHTHTARNCEGDTLTLPWSIWSIDICSLDNKSIILPKFT
jgi:hypothetical protein